MGQRRRTGSAHGDEKSPGNDVPEHHHGRRSALLRITIFFHPDYTVGFGVAPNHALRLVGCTTGGESHPALKILFDFDRIISRPSGLVNRERGEAAAKKRRGAPRLRSCPPEGTGQEDAVSPQSWDFLQRLGPSSDRPDRAGRRAVDFDREQSYNMLYYYKHTYSKGASHWRAYTICS